MTKPREIRGQIDVVYYLCTLLKKPLIQAEILLRGNICHETFKIYVTHLEKCGLINCEVRPYRHKGGFRIIIEGTRKERTVGHRKHYKLTDKGRVFLKLMDDAVSMISEQKG